MAQDNATEAATEAAPAAPAIAEQLPDFTDYLPEALIPYWEIIAHYPIVGAATIALIFFVIAYLVRALVLRSIHKLTAKTSSSLDDAVIQTLSKPIFNTVFIFGLTLATQAAQLPDGITDVTSGTMNLGVDAAAKAEQRDHGEQGEAVPWRAWGTSSASSKSEPCRCSI